MKVNMVVAISANGLISLGTGDEERTFTSPEDQTHFRDMAAKAQSVVMGSTTYEAMKQSLNLGGDGPLHIVLTSKPKEYAKQAVDDTLEFSDIAPEALLRQLQDRGYEDLLVCGGSKVYSAYLRAGIVNDIFLTVEPRFFGTGTPLLDDSLEDTSLTLVEVEPLNETGTLLLHYQLPQRQ